MKKTNAGTRLSADHIESFAAVKKYTETQLGRQMTASEATTLRQSTLTLVYETKLHQTLSCTFEGRSNKTQITAEASNLISAIKKDI